MTFYFAEGNRIWLSFDARAAAFLRCANQYHARTAFFFIIGVCIFEYFHARGETAIFRCGEAPIVAAAANQSISDDQCVWR